MLTRSFPKLNHRSAAAMQCAAYFARFEQIATNRGHFSRARAPRRNALRATLLVVSRPRAAAAERRPMVAGGGGFAEPPVSAVPTRSPGGATESPCRGSGHILTSVPGVSPLATIGRRSAAAFGGAVWLVTGITPHRSA